MANKTLLTAILSDKLGNLLCMDFCGELIAVRSYLTCAVKVWIYYVEIKCQLDATDKFLLQMLLLAQHVSGTIMPIIRSSRVLYKWLLPVVFGALVFKLSSCQVCGQQPANRTHNPQLHTIPTTWKPKHKIRQAATTCIILSSSWWWA